MTDAPHDAVVTDTAPGDGGVQDSGTDAGTDVPTTGDAGDAGTDAVTIVDTGVDVGTDTGVDVSVDVVPVDVPTVDLGTDTGPSTDAGTDTGTTTDAGMDAATDTGPGMDSGPGTDAGTDTGTTTDVGADSGPADAGFCPGAIDLNMAGTLVGNTISYTGDNTMAPVMATYVPTCTAQAGAQVIFTYTTRQTARLTISTVDPNSNFDTVLYALSGCAPTSSEVGCNDDAPVGGPRSEFNVGALPPGITIVITVGGYGAMMPATGTFVLHVTEEPIIGVGGACDPTGAANSCVTGTMCVTMGTTSTCEVPAAPPVESTTTAMCDDLTTVGTALPGAVGDDVATAVLPLPTGFAFTFFGNAIADYSVTSNGFMQLWPDGTGTPRTTYTNAAIPTTAVTNFVAPFWDDLVIPATGGVRSAMLGTAPNRRFVVEWHGAQFYMDATATMTFQAKLFETTNVIELHYCTLTPATNARVFGNSATVGIENAAGTVGTQHSFNTAASVSTTSAIRYTP